MASGGDINSVDSAVVKSLCANLQKKGLEKLYLSVTSSEGGDPWLTDDKGWTDGNGAWKGNAPAKRLLAQELDLIQWEKDDTFAKVAADLGVTLDLTSAGEGGALVDPSLNTRPSKKRKVRSGMVATGGLGVDLEQSLGGPGFEPTSCTECKRPSPPNTKFCGGCGAGLFSWSCKACNHGNLPNNKFCADCGLIKGGAAIAARSVFDVGPRGVPSLGGVAGHLNQGSNNPHIFTPREKIHTQSTYNTTLHYTHLPLEAKKLVDSGGLLPWRFGLFVPVNLQLDAVIGTENDLSLTVLSNDSGVQTVSIDSAKTKDRRKFKRFPKIFPTNLEEFFKGIFGAMLLRMGHYYPNTPSQWRDKAEWHWQMMALGHKHGLSTIYGLYTQFQGVIQQFKCKVIVNWQTVLQSLVGKHSLDITDLSAALPSLTAKRPRTASATGDSAAVARLKKEISALNKKLAPHLRGGPQKGAAKKLKRNKQSCNNFNSQEGCSFQNCRHAHVCSNPGCKDEPHPRHECDKPKQHE